MGDAVVSSACFLPLQSRREFELLSALGRDSLEEIESACVWDVVACVEGIRAQPYAAAVFKSRPHHQLICRQGN